MERRKDKEIEKEEDLKELEQERLKKEAEEKERKEQEEYDKWKDFLTLEDTGNKLDEEKDEENLLEQFINFVKLRKTVNIEDLSMRFDLPNKACIERLNHLVEGGFLKGVVDDRGKFLYIEDQEIEELIKSINSKGHFNRGELIDRFSEIIRLNPSEEDAKQIEKEEAELLTDIGEDFQNMISTED